MADAQNVEEAKMDPENAALISEFARYANGIAGSEQYLPEEMATAIVVPDELQDAGHFNLACPREVQELHTAIWTELQR